LGRGVSDTEIRFGSSLPLTGQVAGLGEAAKAGIEASIQAINADGGIHGRTLTLVTQDDEYIPEKAAANAQYFAEREPVFGIWGQIGTAPTVAAQTLYDEYEMLSLFPLALDQSLFDVEAHPLFFSITPPVYEQLRNWGNYLVNEFDSGGEDVRVAILSNASADGQQTIDGFKASDGASLLVSEHRWEATSATFGPQILTMIDDGVTDVYIGTADTQFAQFLQEANQLGLDARFWGSGSVASQKTVELAGEDLVEGVYAIGYNDTFDSDVAGAQAYREVMEAGGVADDQLGAASILAYVGGLLIKEAATKAGPCLNNETFRTAMESIEDFDVGGLMPNLTFSPENHLGNNSIVIFQVQDGVWKSISSTS